MNHDIMNRQNNTASLVIITVAHVNGSERLKSQVGRGKVRKKTHTLRVWERGDIAAPINFGSNWRCLLSV